MLIERNSFSLSDYLFFKKAQNQCFVVSLAITVKQNINNFLLPVRCYAYTHSLQPIFPFHASLKTEEETQRVWLCSALPLCTPFFCTDNSTLLVLPSSTTSGINTHLSVCNSAIRGHTSKCHRWPGAQANWQTGSDKSQGNLEARR